MSALVVIPADELRAMLREVLREEFNARHSDASPANGMSYSTGTLSVAEAARHAHRHPETLRRAIHDRTLQATKPEGGREWVIDTNELQRWMKAKTPKRSPRASDMAGEVESAVARAREAG